MGVLGGGSSLVSSATSANSAPAAEGDTSTSQRSKALVSEGTANYSSTRSALTLLVLLFVGPATHGAGVLHYSAGDRLRFCIRFYDRAPSLCHLCNSNVSLLARVELLHRVAYEMARLYPILPRFFHSSATVTT